MRRLAFVLALVALSVPASLLASPDLSEVVPGDVHVGVLADVAAIRSDLPAPLVAVLVDLPAEALVAAGLPDLRELVGSVGLGIDLQELQPVEGMAVGAGTLRLDTPIRQLAARLGLDLVETPYRGVTFLQVDLPQALPIAAADLGEEMSFLSARADGQHLRTRHTVDTWLGQRLSLRDRHGIGLDDQTYMVGVVRVPIETRAALRDDPELAGLSYALQGSLVLRRAGSFARLASEIEVATALQARVLEFSLRRSLEKLKQKVTDPDLRELLDRVVISRDGKIVQVRLDLPLGENP